MAVFFIRVFSNAVFWYTIERRDLNYRIPPEGGADHKFRYFYTE